MDALPVSNSRATPGRLLWKAFAALLVGMIAATSASADDASEIDKRIAQNRARLIKVDDQRIWIEQQIADSPRAAADNFTRRQRLREIEDLRIRYEAEIAELTRMAERARSAESVRRQKEANQRAQARKQAAEAERAAEQAAAQQALRDAAGRTGTDDLDSEEVRDLISRWATGESGIPGQVQVQEEQRGLVGLTIAMTAVLRSPDARAPLILASGGVGLVGFTLALLLPLALSRSKPPRRSDSTLHQNLARLGLAASVIFAVAAVGLAALGHEALGDAGLASTLLGAALVLVAAAFGYRGADIHAFVGTAVLNLLVFVVLSAVALSPYGPASMALATLAMLVLTFAQGFGIFGLWQIGPRRVSWTLAVPIAVATGVSGAIAGLGFAAVRLAGS